MVRQGSIGVSAAALVLAAGGLCGPVRAQVVERNLPPVENPTPQAPLPEPPPPPASEDARPLGATLTRIVLAGPEGGEAPQDAAVPVEIEVAVPGRAAALSRALRPFIGRPISRKLISQIEAAVVLHYRRAGRPFVSVSTPEQEITTGVLRLRVLAFHLERKTAQGAARSPPGYIERRIRAAPGGPIDAGRLEQDLTWLNHSPFRQVQARFSAGETLGGTVLTLDAQESKPWQVYGGYSNSGSDATGYDRWFVGAQGGNVLVPDGLFSYQLSASDDVWGRSTEVLEQGGFPTYVSHSAVYVLPLAPRQDLTLVASAIESNQPVQDFVVRQRTTEISAVYRTALSNWVNLPGDVSLGFEGRRQVRALFFGEPKVFQSSVDVGQIVLGYASAWTALGARQSFAATTHVSSGGLDRRNHDADFSAFSNGRVAHSASAYLDLDYSALAPLPKGLFASTRLNLQVADRPLVNTEQIAIGGEAAVRAYTYDDGSFDQGVVWRNELHFPALRLLPRMARVADTLAPFALADFGYTSNRGERGHVRAGALGL